MEISVVRGDITRQPVDAIVTAANPALQSGGGVDHAVHAAAGPELLQACRSQAPCPAGSAVVTPAFELQPVRWVIHAVGPVYSGPADEPVLASTYSAALRCADEVGAASVAFPAISTGAFGYPVEEAAQISVRALRDTATSVTTALLVAYDRTTQQAWYDVLATGR